MATGYNDTAARLVAGGSATVSFTPGTTAQVDSDLVVLWDFDNDGDFDQDVEDITSFVLSGSTQLGRDWPSQVNGQASPGTLTLTLRNDDDRFSQFNDSSPLRAAPYSLRTGRKIRVQAAESTFTDPVLLARDRFRQSNGALLDDELGSPWTFPRSGRFDRSSQTAEADSVASCAAVIDVASDDHYVQARIVRHGLETTGTTGSVIGLLARHESTNDHLAYIVDVDAGTIRISETVAGVTTTLGSNGIEVDDGITIGLRVDGTIATAYVDGVAVFSETITANADGTQVGIIANWNDANQPAPRLDDFHAWDALPQTNPDLYDNRVLFTGEVLELEPDVVAGPEKTATVKAQGVLGRLADIEVESPRFVSAQGTGFMVGRVLSSAGMLSPPPDVEALDPGTASMGPSTFDEDRGQALDFAREFEETERGFLYERPEGYLAFDQAGYRGTEAHTASPQVAFSDRPGAQFGFEEIRPFSSQRDVVNRVTAGVAPANPVPPSITGSTASTASGVGNDVNFTLPADVEDGELLLYMVSSTVAASGNEWLTPIWWVNERESAKDAIRQRIYTHISDGTDGSTVVQFYNDGTTGGAYTWYLFRFAPGEWFGSHEGIHIAEWVKGSNPPVVIPPWGPEPTLYIATRSGLGSSAGASVSGTVYPQGFTAGNSSFVNHATNGFDVAQQYAYRTSNESIMDPGSFGGTFSGFSIVESTVIAIRGFNGSPPKDRGRVTVTVDDRDSQDEHGIITHRATSERFANADAAEAYGEAIVSANGEERPIVSIAFTATKSAHHRLQALQRRLSDRVRLVADGNSGLGIVGDFYIESIRHEFSDGTALWKCTWELSPV